MVTKLHVNHDKMPRKCAMEGNKMREIRVKANILAGYLMLNGTEVYNMFHGLNLIYHVLNGYSYYFIHILFVVFCTRLHVFNFPPYARISN